jgi:predicted transglutaminase-like cysteine proteinase
LHKALSEIAENSADRARARLYQGAALSLQRGAQGVNRIGDNDLGAGGVVIATRQRVNFMRKQRFLASLLLPLVLWLVALVIGIDVAQAGPCEDATAAERRGVVNMARWHYIASMMAIEHQAVSECWGYPAHCSESAIRIINILNFVKSYEAWSEVGYLNSFVNQAIHSGKPSKEDWPDPFSIVLDGKGDCKSYATLKYFLLLELGFSKRDLDLLIVTDGNDQSLHMVVRVRMDGQRWILNNLNNTVPLASDYLKYHDIVQVFGDT